MNAKVRQGGSILKSRRSQLAQTPATAGFIMRWSAVALVLFQLASCSKTVAWEEEVPLNINHTIWVKRTVTYSLKGGAGNPLDIAYRPERNEVIDFNWQGRNYRYEGDARVMVLAIAPNQRPVLVARAADNAWDAVHRYACTLPFYVELVPQPDGRTWAWPSSIEPWLYGLPPNLLLSRHPPDRMRKSYTAQQRAAEDASAATGIPSQARIDPDYTGDICRQTRRK